MDPQSLIGLLTTQHRNLLNELKITQLTEVLSTLPKFKTDLLAHLKLENETFYPDYLAKETQKGNDTTQIQQFIKDMDTIGEVVLKFLEKYNNSEAVYASLPTFTANLKEVQEMLKVRIETEEEQAFVAYLQD